MAAARVALVHATDARSQFPPFARLTCNRHAAGLSGSDARSTVLAHEDHGGTQGVSPLHPARDYRPRFLSGSINRSTSASVRYSRRRYAALGCRRSVRFTAVGVASVIFGFSCDVGCSLLEVSVISKESGHYPTISISRAMTAIKRWYKAISPQSLDGLQSLG